MIQTHRLVWGGLTFVIAAALGVALESTAHAGDRCSSQDTLADCNSDAQAQKCAYCIAPAVTHAIDHNCRAWDYPPNDRRVGIFNCAWDAVGTTRGDDWYAQSFREARRNPAYERSVKAALWDDPDVKGWLDQNIGYWNKSNPWANLEAGCAFGCAPELERCEVNCPLNAPAIKTCYNLIQATVPRVTHHIYHHCKDRILWGHPDHIAECGFSQMMGDDYGKALDGGLIHLCKNLDSFRKQIYENADVKAMVKQHISYWNDANSAASAELDTQGEPRGEARDGPTVATNWLPADNLPDETCTSPGFGAPQWDYYPTPPRMLDWEPTESDGSYLTQGFRPRSSPPPKEEQYRLAAGFIGANEGRLRKDLRKAASDAKPLASLCKSALSYAHGDDGFGKAYADLAVTGRNSFALFVAAAPTEATVRGQPDCQGTPDAALRKAVDRAYAVAAAIRAGNAPARRRALGWIAVSGEDDQPYRPVNVPSTSFPQFSLAVPVNDKPTVTTRYMIAHARPPAFPAADRPLVDGGSGRVVPADAIPTLAPDAQVILFIHGMDSRLEEALDLTAALHRLAAHGGKNWTVISMDLPTSGYADNIDHLKISKFDAINHDHDRAAPLVDYIEDYIVSFVDELDRKIPVKAHLRAVVGGSLGGNMAMRLGRRPNADWVRAVVPWSPAAIWPSYDNDAWGGVGHVNRPYSAVTQALAWAGQDPNQWEEKAQRRMEYFYGSFDWRPAGAVGAILDPSEHMAQADLWFRAGWKCKGPVILGARIDRQETYDANFRRWHWRLGAEQLLFSQQESIPPGHYISDRYPALYWKNTKPMFLSCGFEDVGGDLCSQARDVSGRMFNTPGYFRYLGKTGHSIDNERPNWMAKQIVDFLQ